MMLTGARTINRGQMTTMKACSQRPPGMHIPCSMTRTLRRSWADFQSLEIGEDPFGLPNWKPAHYCKSRIVTRNAETSLPSVPNAATWRVLLPRSLFWTLLFGWWLALVPLVVAGILFVVFTGGWTMQRLYGSSGGTFLVVWHVCRWGAEISTHGDDADPIGDSCMCNYVGCWGYTRP